MVISSTYVKIMFLLICLRISLQLLAPHLPPREVGRGVAKEVRIIKGHEDHEAGPIPARPAAQDRDRGKYSSTILGLSVSFSVLRFDCLILLELFFQS